MEFEPLPIDGARLVHLTAYRDVRGTFARVWCSRTFREQGITFDPKQGNLSMTHGRGSLRGMHFQREPMLDAKIVRCTVGAIYDVIADLRDNSPTFGRWCAHELTETSNCMLYIPPGCAHGFQVLSEHCAVEYLMGEFYSPDLSDGFRYDDLAFGIQWPLAVKTISDRDLAWPAIATRALASAIDAAGR